MIVIDHKADCCGCEACVQRCPKGCIDFREDAEGFRYPQVDAERCIDCGLCERVCPVLHRDAPRAPQQVFAAKNPDEDVRRASSSGGVFSMLAQSTIDRGGVVFGAGFDDQWAVVHDCAETAEGLAAFRGSKYVQSRIGESFVRAERFLKSGREVLFSGTPCQIAGLRRFLGREYENLLTVDVVCHGVPSPAVWRRYLEGITRPEGAVGKNTVSSSLNEIPVITGISFRDKKLGWKKFGFEIRGKAAFEAAENSVLESGMNLERIVLSEPLTENVYMRGFLCDLYLRPVCHACPARAGRSGSDLTIADFWGIGRFYPQFDDDKGVSLVLVGSEQGAEAFARLSTEGFAVSYEQALAGNPAIERNPVMPRCRKRFWRLFPSRGIDVIVPLCRRIEVVRFCRRVVSFAKRIMKRL